jgi:hypothetical protein
MPVIPVNSVVVKERIIFKKWRAEVKARHKPPKKYLLA